MLFFLGASGTVRIDESGDRDPDYSLKYYVNGSFQNIADYNHSTGGFNLRGHFFQNEVQKCRYCMYNFKCFQLSVETQNEFNYTNQSQRTEVIQ